MESGEHGYVIPAQPIFLEPINAGREQLTHNATYSATEEDFMRQPLPARQLVRDQALGSPALHDLVRPIQTFRYAIVNVPLRCADMEMAATAPSSLTG